MGDGLCAAAFITHAELTAANYAAFGFAESCTPSASSTFMMVSNSGLVSPLSAR